MRRLYDRDLKANVTYDDAGRVRGINHHDEFREMDNLRGREAAAAYLREIAGSLKVPRRALRNVDQRVSYLDPRQQDMEYRFGQEKASFGLATYVYDQTFLNTPVWMAGLTVTLKQAPARIVGATDTSEHRINAKLPSPEALERYRRLFATGEKTDGPSPRRQAQPSQQPESAGSDLLTRILGRAANVAKTSDGAPVLPQLIGGRFFIYRFDAVGRTESEPPTLPLSPVPHSIHDGSWYLVAELLFRLPHDGVPMNWRILVDVETDTILSLRALSSCLVRGKVFPHDPVTSTGVAKNTCDQSNDVLNRHRKDEELHNLNPPAGKPLSQSLEGRWAAVTNLHPPNVRPPKRPAGSNFDVFDVRTNDFAAVSAYYHVDRFFRLVADLGFPVTGANGYFAGTRFPVEVDHRAFRAPWADGNVVNAALLGHGDGIDSVYFALADFRGGSVARVTVTNGGRGYKSPPKVTLIPDHGARAIVKPRDIKGGAVTAVHVRKRGKGYPTGPLVKFSGGGGRGAFAVAEIDVRDPVGIAVDWRVALHELSGHGTLWSHVGQSQFRFSHSAGDSFAMILNDYGSEWHNNGRVPDRFTFLPFIPNVVRRSDRGLAERSLAKVNVTNPGSGYLSVSFKGGGVAAAQVMPHHVVRGAVTKVTVTDPGKRYEAAPSVIFSGGGGTGAAAIAKIGASGSVTRVTVVKRGKGYKHPPKVSFTGGGVEQAHAGVRNDRIIDGVVTGVTVTDPGMGYTTAPKVVITGGSGTRVTATAQIAAGSVTGVTVTHGGTGHTPLVVKLTGGHVQATAEATVADGSVTAVTVKKGGKGYGRASVVFSGDAGSGAAGTAQIDSSGTVTGVIVTAGGRGYKTAPTVTLTDAGVPDAQAIVKPDDVIDGAVTKVFIAEPGTAYTSAPTVTFGGGGAGAAGTAELGTWGWGQGMDQGTDGKLGSGYFSEQILSTTMFRAYRSIGGDAANIHRREFAARFMVFLMLEAIAQLHPISNPKSPAEFLNALLIADAADWTTEGAFGGAYGKVLHWAFEKQNLHNGARPSVDVYIDDGRAGEYQYEPVYWASTAIWNRRKPDGLSGHQEPALGRTNYAYVKIKNRGTSAARNVIVRGYRCKPSAGGVWPHDLRPLATPLHAAGTLRPNNKQEKTVGPFEWTPAADGWGHDGLVMIVSADGDPSNVGNLTMGGVIEDWRLVPNDNNVAQRNVVLVPGGGGARGLKAGLHRKGLWVGNPGRSSANIAASVVLPPLLAKRGWRIALRNLAAKGARLKAHEQRLVTFDVRAGRPFSKADAQAAKDRDLVVTVTANGAIIGGMTYRIDPALRMPFNGRASAS
jgi:hypothetical protein